MLLNLKQYTPYLVFIFFFTCFLLSTAPAVYWFDEGEMITAITLMGLPHSPSFPLFVQLVKPIAYLPLGSIAFRVNLVSGIFGAACLVVLLRIMFILMTPYRLPGNVRSSRDTMVIPALFFLAVTDIWWFQSTRVEVYTLNALLSSVVVYLLVSSRLYIKNQMLIFLLLGIGLANHSLLFAHIFPGCFLYLLSYYLKDRRKLSFLPVLAIFSLLGLSIYLYLPMRSILNPVPDLGDPENYSGFMLSFFRKHSLGKFFGNNLTQFIDSFKIFAVRFYDQYTPIGSILVIMGIFHLSTRSFNKSMLLILIISVNIMTGLLNKNFTDNPDTMDAYFLNAYQFSAVFMAMGMVYVLGKIYKLSLIYHSKVIFATRYILVIVLFIVSILSWINKYPSNALRNDDFPRKFGKTILDLASPNAIVFTGYYTNTHFILMEMIYSEKYRDDLAIIDRAAILHWHRYDNYVKDRYPYLAYPTLYLFQNQTDTSSPDLVDTIQDRQTLYKILKQYTKLLVELNLPQHPIYWMTSEDDYMLFQKLAPRGPLFQVMPSKFSSNSQHDEFLDSEIFTRMKNLYLDDPSFIRNNKARKTVASQFMGMAATYAKSGYSNWATLETDRALNIYPEFSNLY